MPRKAMLRSGAAKYVIYVFNERSLSVCKGTFEHPYHRFCCSNPVGWVACPTRPREASAYSCAGTQIR